MPKRSATTMTNIPAYIARTQLGALLKQISQKRARFVITKSVKPTAVLMSITDFDDMFEELDPEFQKSLTAAHRENRAGQGITLQEYLKERMTSSRGRA